MKHQAIWHTEIQEKAMRNHRQIPKAITTLFFSGLGFFASPAAQAQDAKKPIEIAQIKRPADKPVSFANEIADILDNKCNGCHNDALAENKLKMETVAQMLKGGKRGPALKPGKADESLLFQMGSHRADPVMPPKDKKDLKPWSPEETALIKLWIDQGATDDTNGTPSEKPKPAIVLGQLPAKFAPIYALDLAADERVLAAGRGAQLHLVEPVTGFVIATLGGHQDAIQSVRFRPDAGEVAAGSYRIVTRWALPKLTIVKTTEKMPYETALLEAEPNTSLAWAVSATEPKLRLIEPATGKEVRVASWAGAPAKAVARSAFGPELAVLGTDGSVKVLGSEKGDLIQALPAPKSAKFSAIAWLAKGKLAAGQSDGQIQLLEITGPGKAGLKPGPLLAGKQGPVQALKPSADGKQLLALSKDQTLELWDAAAGKPLKQQVLSGSPVTVFYISAADGSILTGQANGTVSRWSKDLSAKISENTAHTAPVVAIQPTKKNSQLLVAYQDGLVRAVNPADFSTLWAWNAAQRPSAPQSVALTALLALANDQIVTAAKDKSTAVWTLDGKLAAKSSLENHLDRVLAIDYSPDGKRLATSGGEASRSGEVRLWNAETGALEKHLDSLHSDTVFGLRFSPDGKFLATCAADKFAKITQLSDYKTLRPLEGHTNHVLGVDWKADGKELATAGADQALKLWNVQTGEQTRTAQQAGKQITAVRWSATKPMVVGSSGDKNVRIWNPDNGQISRTLGGANDFLFAVATNKDASVIYAAGQNGLIHAWSGVDGKALKPIVFTPKADAVAKK